MTATPHKRKLTLLVQNLRRLVAVAHLDNRYPALETVLSKGRHFHAVADSADHFRFHLFGVESVGELPVAALTRAGIGGKKPDRQQYWLRTDPVTLWADMARLIMTGHGLADLNEYERNEIENTVRSVLLEEGIQFHADHPERWCIALNKPVDCAFKPLDEALGMDLADLKQVEPDALYWRRVMNEIQIALHSCPVNVRRRQYGQQEINSVWFWGGGFIPEAAEHAVFDTIYSDNPVSRGLAAINDCHLKTQKEFVPNELAGDGQSILVDWTANVRDPELELQKLESLAEKLLAEMVSNSDELVLYCGRLNGWQFDGRANRRFWRRRRSLGKICHKMFPS